MISKIKKISKKIFPLFLGLSLISPLKAGDLNEKIDRSALTKAGHVLFYPAVLTGSSIALYEANISSGPFVAGYGAGDDFVNRWNIGRGLENLFHWNWRERIDDDQELKTFVLHPLMSDIITATYLNSGYSKRESVIFSNLSNLTYNTLFQYHPPEASKDFLPSLIQSLIRAYVIQDYANKLSEDDNSWKSSIGNLLKYGNIKFPF